MEIVALVSSIVSVIIGGFAIWLAVEFYKMSNVVGEDTKQASKGISASVVRLESLFDRLYSDTFSMMKDTVSDMRKHIWPDNEEDSSTRKKIDERADGKIEELRTQINGEISSIARQLGDTDDKISIVENRLTELIDKAITQTRIVENEAQEEVSSVLAKRIYLFLENVEEITVVDLYRRLVGKGGGIELEHFFDALELLQRADEIAVIGDTHSPESIISLKERSHNRTLGQKFVHTSKRRVSEKPTGSNASMKTNSDGNR